MYRSLAMERGFFVSRLEEILKLTRRTGGGGIGEGGIFSKTAPKKYENDENFHDYLEKKKANLVSNV